MLSDYSYIRMKYMLPKDGEKEKEQTVKASTINQTINIEIFQNKNELYEEYELEPPSTMPKLNGMRQLSEWEQDHEEFHMIPDDILEDNAKMKKKHKDYDKTLEEKEEFEHQTESDVLRQLLIPFTIAGFGSVFAGIVLHEVHVYPVFNRIPQLEIMIPAFLGLIGNIETTLASRLSTHSNLGTLDSWTGLSSILTGNMLVVQCQAAVLGLFAALSAIVISSFKKSTREAISLENVMLLSAGSTVTSIIVNSFLSAVISIVIITARKFRVNPDNIATPVAASMGDVCSIAILSIICEKLYEWKNLVLEIVLISTLISLALVYGYLARWNKYSKTVIYTGWAAIVGAVVVEQPGGIVMESSFAQFKVMSTFQPLVNGIGSNLVGIQTSRMSTYLHSVCKEGELPESNPRYCVGPFWVFLSCDANAKMARLLLFVVIPTHLFFMTIIYLMQNQFDFSLHITTAFIGSYCAAVLIQLSILLYLAYISVHWAWKRKINPDNSAIPFTSALADVLGNCLMALAFIFLKSIGDPNADVTDEV